MGKKAWLKTTANQNFLINYVIPPTVIYTLQLIFVRTHSAIVWIAGWATQPTRQSCALLVGLPCPFGNRMDCWLGHPSRALLVGLPCPFGNCMDCWLSPSSRFDNIDTSSHSFIRSHSILALTSTISCADTSITSSTCASPAWLVIMSTSVMQDVA